MNTSAPLRRACWFLSAALSLGPAFAQDAPPASQSQSIPLANPEIEKLKAQLAAQQEQLKQMQRAIEQQQKLIEDTLRVAADQAQAHNEAKPADNNLVASTTPVLPPVVVNAVHSMARGAAPMMQKESTQEPSPLSLRIGETSITPVGFMDFTTVTRSTNMGSGIGSNFGGTPYSNTPAGKLAETRFSPQNSRLGLRFDTMFHNTHVLGYWESDFLGFVPTNAPVSTNAYTFRLRLFYVDLRHGKLEILGGQSWSMLTPNRNGISPIPGDIFYSQNIDVNYQLGLVWSRNPQFRILYHANDIFTLGLSLEQPEQYIGGTNGSGSVTLPTAFQTSYANEVDTGGNTLAVPNVRPDVIVKLAFDPKWSTGKAHFEVAGVTSTFRTYNPLNSRYYNSTGGGGSVNAIVEPVKNFRLLSNNFWSDGGGRWIFGQAPDFVIRGDGSPSNVHAGSTVDGFEAQRKNTLVAGYYGGVYIGRNVVIDPANGKFAGYGYPGSPNNQNKSIHELTLDVNQTLWKDPRYGAVNMMFQYSYLLRYPWAVAPGAPRDAHASMVFFNLRYTLPGEAPKIKY